MATDSIEKTGSSSDEANYKKSKPRKHNILNLSDVRADELNAVFETPLARVPNDQLLRDVEAFCELHGLMEHLEDMRKGALVSKAPDQVHNATYLNEQERDAIIHEKTHKWDIPGCCIGSAVKSYCNDRDILLNITL